RGGAANARDRARGRLPRRLRRGDAPALRRARPDPAGRGDGRGEGERPDRLRRRLRIERLEGRQLRAVQRRLGQPVDRRRDDAGRGLRQDRARAAHAHRLARGRPREGAPAVEGDAPLLGTVAIVGFPNVGKSTLVNRLTGTRAAVVHETPGVTRDRKELLCEWAGTEFRLIDTGGVDVADPSPITRSIAEQARAAVAEADLVLFVVDAKAGITPGDEEVAQILRSSRKPIYLLVNKIDDPARDAEALEFHRLGLGDPIPLSALHGYGTGDLLDALVARLPGSGPAQVGDEAIRVAILGRPNVGKSSLLNAILG